MNTKMVNEMKDMVGWEDEKYKDRYFVYVGDEELTVGFYKDVMTIIDNWYPNNYEEDRETLCETISFSEYADLKWSKWNGYKAACDSITVKPKNGYYVFRMKYKGDEYKVYFGYGVDIDFYKKTRRVNYYRSPEYYIRRLKYEIRWKFDDIKAYLKYRIRKV